MLKLTDARYCLDCNTVLTGEACSCGNTTLFVLESLICPEELRAQIYFSRPAASA